MIFEWDEDKRRKNRESHGIDFATIEEFDWGTAIQLVDDRQDYGEERIVAWGFIQNRVHVCVYTGRGEKRRIISLRKANKREEDYYEQETAAPD
jgi:uncharacterized DUF497 family protein